MPTTLKVRKLIQNKFGSRGAINKVDIERSPNLVTVTIATAKAGVVIGRGGQGAQELKAGIEKMYSVPVRVNIEEVKKPDLYAKLVAENIAHQLERRMSFRRAIKSAGAATMRAGAKGRSHRSSRSFERRRNEPTGKRGFGQRAIAHYPCKYRLCERPGPDRSRCNRRKGLDL